MLTGSVKRPRVAALAALIAVVAVTGLIYALREVMAVEASGVLYLLPVLIGSSLGGLYVGIGASLVSAAAFNFFHIPPTGEFTIADEENWVALVVFVVVAAVTSTLAGVARDRAEEAERRRREADLTAEMARVLLGGRSIADSLRTVGQRIANAFELAWVEVELGWKDSDNRRRSLPVLVDGERVGTVAVPRDTGPALIEALERRLVPSLETLLIAARQREELEAQVIETRALRRANVVKTALLRSVSHDLRSPLTAITAAAGGLSSPTLNEQAQNELIAVIATESERLTRLVDNLLDLSQLQAGQIEPRLEPCPVEELIEGALASVGSAGEQVLVTIERELPMVQVDVAQIERALANVIENSVRFSGGEPVAVHAQRVGPQVAVRVSDRGPGIPRADLDRVFEPFYRGEAPRGQGSGLGLAIARGFVDANGGELRVQSQPGQGTTFALNLPAAEPMDSPPAEPAPEREAA